MTQPESIADLFQAWIEARQVHGSKSNTARDALEKLEKAREKSSTVQDENNNKGRPE